MTYIICISESGDDGRVCLSLFFPPTGYIQASRALMIASIVFGTLGIVATLSGMQCSKIGGENYLLKGRIATIGGVFFLLQGSRNGGGAHTESMFLEHLTNTPGEQPLRKIKHLERWITCCTLSVCTRSTGSKGCPCRQTCRREVFCWSQSQI